MRFIPPIGFFTARSVVEASPPFLGGVSPPGPIVPRPMDADPCPAGVRDDALFRVGLDVPALAVVFDFGALGFAALDFAALGFAALGFAALGFAAPVRPAAAVRPVPRAGLAVVAVVDFLVLRLAMG